MKRPRSAALSGMTQAVAGSRGWATIGKPNSDGRPAVISSQVDAAVVGPVDAAVVLLVERLGLARGRDELVDALAELRGRAGHEVGPDAAVARLPRRSAVAGLEGPDGGDADPHPLRVGGVGHDRVEDEAAVAGLPRRPRRVLGQAGHVRPGRAVVVAPEEPGRLDAGEDRAVGSRHVPDGGDRRPVVAVGQAGRRVRPGLAEVVGAPDGRAVPRTPGGGVDRPARRVDADVVDRPALAERAAQRPGGAASRRTPR